VESVFQKKKKKKNSSADFRYVGMNADYTFIFNLEFLLTLYKITAWIIIVKMKNNLNVIKKMDAQIELNRLIIFYMYKYV